MVNILHPEAKKEGLQHTAVRRDLMIVATDLTSAGDLFCIELLPEISYNAQLAFAVMWGVVAVLLAWYNHRVKKDANIRAWAHLQSQQPLFVIYPLLKFGTSLSVLFMMHDCYSDPETSSASVLSRYLLMIEMTCSTVFYSLFYALEYMSMAGFGIVSFSVTREQAKLTIFLIGFSYICDSAYFVTMDSRMVNSALRICIVGLQFLFLVKATRAALTAFGTLSANEKFIRQTLSADGEENEEGQALQTSSLGSAVSEVDSYGSASNNSVHSSAARPREQPLVHHHQQVPEQENDASFHQLIGGDSDGELQGLARLLQAIAMKRSMLLTHTICTLSLILLQAVLVLLSPTICRPGLNSEVVIRIREKEDPAHSLVLVPENQTKMTLIIVREALYFAFIVPILFVMRMRRSFPDFYGCELSADPWTEGVFGDLELGDGDPFFDMPIRMRADGPGNQLATIRKVRIKRKHFVGACSEIESNMSDAFAQEKEAERRGEHGDAHHQFLVLNPAVDQTSDSVKQSPYGSVQLPRRKRKRPTNKQIEEEKAQLAATVHFALLDDAPGRGPPVNNLLQEIPRIRTYDFRNRDGRDGIGEAGPNPAASSLRE